MVQITGVEAADWHGLQQYWWQYVKKVVAIRERHAHALLGLNRIHSYHSWTRIYVLVVPHSEQVLQ
jgi:hypothetical protein